MMTMTMITILCWRRFCYENYTV